MELEEEIRGLAAAVARAGKRVLLEDDADVCAALAERLPRQQHKRDTAPAVVVNVQPRRRASRRQAAPARVCSAR